ncbi:hypothetical protein [Microbacterium sp.]|uniref:hypothetical protein n=1 Tax=Microbacterium sp. TaxID=51671 RepID=UPI002E354A34|nr:hypothetical protein [Microbacterium sp.]HEX5730500.1 hypothetical protein [Microbacterium sp.]
MRRGKTQAARTAERSSQRFLTAPKAIPSGAADRNHYRLRYDRVDTDGKMSLRRAGRMHHLGIGTEHRGKRILALADEHSITVVHLDTGKIIATNTIQPGRTYWRNTMKAPGRWPGASQK